MSSIVHPESGLKKILEKLEEIQREGGVSLGDARPKELDRAEEVISGHLQGEVSEETRALLEKITGVIEQLEPCNVQVKIAKRVFAPIKSVTASLLVNVVGDEFASGSRLEGSSNKLMLKHVKDFLIEVKDEYGIDEETLDELRFAAQISEALVQEASSEVQEEIHQLILKRLDEGKKVLLPGGWTGVLDGHAIYHELIPQRGGNVSFRHYNLGDGVSIDNPLFLDGCKRKTVPYVEWQNIPIGRIKHLSFFKTLVELNSQKMAFGEATKYGATDIYRAWKDALRPEVVYIPDAKEELVEIKSLQLSGTCTCRSLMAWLSTRIPKEAYKKLRLQMTVETASRFVQGRDTLSLVDFKVLQKTHKKLCRKTLKALTLGRISEGIFKEMTGKLTEMKKALDKPLAVEDPKLCALVYTNPNNPLKIPEMTPLLASEWKVVSSDLQPERQGVSYARINTLFTDDLPPLERLEKLAGVLKESFLLGDHEAIEMAIFNGLPSVSAYEVIKDCVGKPEVAQKAMIDLGSISDTFFKNTFYISQATSRDPRRNYVGIKLYLMIVVLAEIADPRIGRLKYGDMVDQVSQSRHEFEEHYGYVENTYEVKDANDLLYFLPLDMKLDLEQLCSAELDNSICDDQRFRRSIHLKGSHREWSDHSNTACYTCTELKFEDNNFLFSILPFGNSDSMIKRIWSIVGHEVEEAAPENERIENQKEGAHFETLWLTRHIRDRKLPEWLQALIETGLRAKYQAWGKITPPVAPKNWEGSPFVFKQSEAFWKTEWSISPPVSGDLEFSREDQGNFKFVADVSTKYRQNHPSFTTNAWNELFLALQKESDREVSYHEAKEKDILCATPKMHECQGVDSEDFRELLHLMGDKRRVFHEVLSYFTYHREKLKDPNFQILFRTLFLKYGFDNHYLQIAYNETNVSQKVVYQFLSENLRYFAQLGEYQTAIFFLKVARELSKELAPPGFYEDLLPQVRALQNNHALEREDRILLAIELMAHLTEKEELAKEEVQELLLAAIYYQNYPLPPHFREFSQARVMQEALIKHSSAVKNLLSQTEIRAQILNEISAQFVPAMTAVEWEVKSEDPFHVVSADGRFSCLPCEGKFIDYAGKKPLPAFLKNNPVIQRLFPNVNDCTLFSSDTYELHDDQGRKTLVSMKNYVLIIDQEHDGVWLRYVPDDVLIYRKKDPSLFGKDRIHSASVSRYISSTHAHWIDPSSPEKIIATRLGTGEKAYEYELQEGSIAQVVRVSDGAKLSVPSETFLNFEEDGYIHEWTHKDGFVSEVEFPRHGMRFTRTKSDAPFVSAKFSGHQLSVQSTVPGLEPFTNYLYLTSVHEDDMLVVPRQFFKMTKPYSEVFEPTFDILRETEELDAPMQRHFVYTIDNHGELHPKTRESGLYLALLYTLTQDYRKGSQLLKKYGSNPAQITKNEKEVLQNIAKLHGVTKDMCGNATGVRLLANLMVLKRDMIATQSLCENFVNYLEHLNHVTEVAIPREDEIMACKAILERQFDYLVYKRLRTLDPVAAQNIQRKEDEKEGGIERIEDLAQYLALEGAQETLIGEEKGIPFTRAGKYIKYKEIVTMYNTALNRGMTFIQKNPYIPYMRYGQDGMYRNVVLLLEMVAKYPKEFWPAPVIIPGERNPDVRDWAERTIGKANELLFKEGARPTKEKRPPIDLDPDALLRAIPVNFTPVEIDPLPKVPLASCNPTEGFDSALSHNAIERHEKAAFELKEMKERTAAPLAKKMLDGIIAELLRKMGQEQKVEYLPKSLDVLENLRQQLKNESKAPKDKIATLEKEALELANREGSDKLTLERWGGLKKILSMEDLIVAFGKMDVSIILENNPTFDEEESKKLLHIVGQYLLHATKLQQIERAESKIHDILTLDESAVALRKSETAKLLDILGSKERKYNPDKSPMFLVFEYMSEKTLFQRQIDLIEKFIQSGDESMIEELCMGSGKSAVLRPLLAMMRADGKALSMVIIPHALFEEGVSETYESMRETLSRELVVVHFDRSTPLTPLHLESIRDQLELAIPNRRTIAMTSKSVHCIALRFVELYREHVRSGKNKLTENIEMLRQILAILSNAGVPLIDEADSILNVLHDTSYAIGDPISPEEADLAITEELFSLWYTDLEMRSFASLESDPKASDAPPFTKQYYHENIKHHFAEKILDRLEAIPYRNRDIEEKISAFVVTMDRELTLSYITRDKERVMESQAYFDKQNPEVQDVLALLGEQLCSMLPHTLQKVSDEEYGLDEEEGGITAIPFVAVKTPSKGSEFAHPLVTCNLTYQIIVRKGAPLAILEEEVAKIQSAVMKELIDDPTLDILQTEAWSRYSALCNGVDFPLFNYKPHHLQKLQAHINSNYAMKLAFVKNVILPQLKLYSESITSNAHIFAALFNQVTGFTGTLWNSGSMHSKLRTEPSDEIVARTLSLLFKDENSQITITPAKSSKELIENLDGLYFDLLIDTGGYCKDAENFEVAEMFAAQFQQPTVYYDSAGMQSATHEDTKSRQKVFLDQKHTTGAHVKQERDFVGLVTIGDHMLLRDLVQGVWRLRSIEHCQTVHFVISDRVTKIIKNKLGLAEEHEITLSDLILFVVSNQSQEQGEQNFLGLTKQLSSIPQMILIKALLSTECTDEQKEAIFEKLSSRWINTVHKRPREQFGQIHVAQETKSLVEAQNSSTIKELEELFVEFPWLEQIGIEKKSLLKEVQEAISHASDSLHPFSEARIPGLNGALEIERAQDLDVDTNLRVENDKSIEKVCSLKYIQMAYRMEKADQFDLALFKNKNTSHFSLKSYFDKVPELKQYASAFDGIDISINVLQWTVDEPYTTQEVKFFGEHRTPFHYLKYYKDDLVILSQIDEVRLPKEYRESPSHHLTLGQLEQNPAKLPEDLQLRLLKVKFLDGRSNFTKKEIEMLRPWIQKEGSEKMERFFTEHVLLGFPKKRQRYQGSTLKSLFSE